MRIILLGQNQSMSCPFCGTTTSDTLSLARHIGNCKAHKKLLDQAPVPNPPAPSPDDLDEQDDFLVQLRNEVESEGQQAASQATPVSWKDLAPQSRQKAIEDAINAGVITKDIDGNPIDAWAYEQYDFPRLSWFPDGSLNPATGSNAKNMYFSGKWTFGAVKARDILEAADPFPFKSAVLRLLKSRPDDYLILTNDKFDWDYYGQGVSPIGSELKHALSSIGIRLTNRDIINRDFFLATPAQVAKMKRSHMFEYDKHHESIFTGLAD